MPSKFNHQVQNQFIAQTSWTPTKRRGPIAAEFSTPGPAVISLPSTFGPNSRDQRKTMAPAYTFGFKVDEKKDTKTPGPGEYNVDKVTRMGKEWAPTVFMSPKYKEPEPFNTPAPGTYNVDKLTRVGKDWAPTVFMSPKYKEPEPFKTPAPGTYNVDKLTRMGKDWAPTVFMSPKYNEPERFRTPSPTAYNTEKVWINKSTPLSASFGIHHSPYSYTY